MPDKHKHKTEKNSKHEHEHEPLKIRAHHLCCIQGFQGYGYSPAFVANMRAVISDLEALPSRPLKLVTECDAICISCPSKRECNVQQSHLSRGIRQMDLTVLDKVSIEDGTVLRADEAFRLVNSIINSPSDIEDVCGTCKWRQKCLWYMQEDR